MKVIDFSEVFGERAEGETPPDILPEAAVERLREASPRYVGPCPFKQ